MKGKMGSKRIDDLIIEKMYSTFRGKTDKMEEPVSRELKGTRS